MKTTASDPAVGSLNEGEQQDFDLIVCNAHAMGWLPRGETLVATHDEAGVLVRAVSAESCQERRYPDRQRWLLHLLHELAQGMWKRQLASCLQA